MAIIALAIVLDTAALVTWNIGTRPPVRLLADLRTGFSNQTVLARGIYRFLAGSLLLFLGIIIAIPIVRFRNDFSILEIWIMIAALIIEQICGEDIRSWFRPVKR